MENLVKESFKDDVDYIIVATPFFNGELISLLLDCVPDGVGVLAPIPSRKSLLPLVEEGRNIVVIDAIGKRPRFEFGALIESSVSGESGALQETLDFSAYALTMRVLEYYSKYSFRMTRMINPYEFISRVIRTSKYIVENNNGVLYAETYKLWVIKYITRNLLNGHDPWRISYNLADKHDTHTASFKYVKV